MGKSISVCMKLFDIELMVISKIEAMLKLMNLIWLRKSQNVFMILNVRV